MTNVELDEMIEWCRKRLATPKKYGLTGKRLEGYKEALLAVMSYLHSKKKEDIGK